MIKLYPVLVANSVSKNIIPGICKAIERFALIYKLDAIAKQAHKNLNLSLRKVGNKIVMKEETDKLLINYLTNEIILEGIPYFPNQRFGPGTKSSATQRVTGASQGIHPAAASVTSYGNQPQPEDRKSKTPDEEREIAKQKEIGRREATPGDATIAIGQMDMKSLMLEPTWMKVDMVARGGMRFTTVLGVKAVPAYVQSDSQLAQLLSFDKQVGRLMHLVLNYGRKVSGLLYRLYARTLQKVFDPDPRAISGNPYKDIVLKRTIIEEANIKDIFLVLNQADLEEDFAISAKGVRKLMRLGWQSFCIADDINRRLTFCMSEFKGMCQTIPYTMVYHSLDQARVFEDLEDVRRSTTSLFKSKIAVNKVFGESIAQKKLEEFSVDLFSEPQYQEFLNEITYIDESLGSIMKKAISAPKEFIIRMFKGTIQVPQPSMDKLMKVGKKIDSDFIKAHMLAKRVLSNSLNLEGVKEVYVNWLAYAVIIRAKTMPGKNLLIKTKDTLLAVMPMIRKLLRKAKATTLNIPPEHRVEAALGLSALFILVIGLSYFYVITLIAAFKIKPVIGDIMQALSKYFLLAFTSLKTWVVKGAEALSQADVSTANQKELLTSFWGKYFTQSTADLKVMYAKLKASFESQQGAIEKNLEGHLQEHGLTFEEAGAMILLCVIGIFAIRSLLRPPK
jgi:hypothetical protein